MKVLKRQHGFTLIELVIVIVILGILGVAVVGKYQSLEKEAKVAAVQGIAAELSGASKVNYAKCRVNATSSECESVNSSFTCENIANVLLKEDGGASFSTNTLSCSQAGDTANCTVTKDGYSANATLICTGP